MNIEKEKRAIEYLRTFAPESEPYYLCYSGGKDSDCIRILAPENECDSVHDNGCINQWCFYIWLCTNAFWCGFNAVNGSYAQNAERSA